MRRTILLLSVCTLFAPVLTMCNSFDDTVPPAGLVKAGDPEAAALLQRAKAFKAAGRERKAIRALKDLRRKHPLSAEAPEARFLLAGIYEEDGDYREAFKEYGKLIERYQDSSLYDDALNRQLALATAAANGKLKTDVLWGAWKTDMESSVVRDWLKSIITNAPYNDMSATAASILGKYLYDRKMYDQSRQVYAKLVEDYPDSRYAPQAQLMVASIWASDRTRGNRNMVNLANAREAYEEFTLRFPNHPQARKAMGEAANVDRLLVEQELEVGRYYLERSREYTSAIFCFEEVIRQKRKNPEAAAEAEKLLGRARALEAAARSGKAQGSNPILNLFS